MQTVDGWRLTTRYRFLTDLVAEFALGFLPT